jgi:uncharacterized cupredoxin-like copper-binding protein
MMRRVLRHAVVLALALVLAACSGSPAATGASDRTVAVTMSDDMRYNPDTFEFLAGETVRFEVTNAGLARHEFFVGDLSTHEEHAAEMRDMVGSPMDHEEPGLMILEGGASGTLDYTFAEAGEFLIGCHEPGHYEAGMVADITVHPAP